MNSSSTVCTAAFVEFLARETKAAVVRSLHCQHAAKSGAVSSQLVEETDARHDLILFWSSLEALVYDCFKAHLAAYPELLQRAPLRDCRVTLGVLGGLDSNLLAGSIAREALRTLLASGGAAYGGGKLTKVFEFLGYSVTPHRHFASCALLANALRDVALHSGSRIDTVFKIRVPFVDLETGSDAPFSSYENYFIKRPIYLYVAAVQEVAARAAGVPELAKPLTDFAAAYANTVPVPPRPFWREPIAMPE